MTEVTQLPDPLAGDIVQYVPPVCQETSGVALLLANIRSDEGQPVIIAEDPRHDPFAIGFVELVGGEVRGNDGRFPVQNAVVEKIPDGGLGEGGAEFRAEIVDHQKIAFGQEFERVSLAAAEMLLLQLMQKRLRRRIDHAESRVQRPVDDGEGEMRFSETGFAVEQERGGCR